MTANHCEKLLLAWLLAAVVVGWPALLPAQRNLKNIPVPDAELERQSFILPEGFEVNLYASDPKIAKPIQMNFDAAGRLWVASSSVYPHIKPGQQADDKVLVIEDRDGDGRADRTTVFADQLLIPTGVVPGDGGVYVVNSTELLHLSDTDGDGKGDRRRVVLSGFGSEDTHHLLHTLRWGHDGALYMNQSIYIHSHVETPFGVRRLGGGGIWRFRPDTMQLDVLCRGFVNPWGHHFDYWGQSFATDGAYREGINYVFPGSVFVTAPGAKRFVTGLNPGSPKHCGLEIVGGGHLPDDWQGNMITNDFRAHRVCRFVVREDGAGYSSRQETELIKSKHAAFRPIDVKMGPDGAIYIADWYNPIIQHGEVDFRDARRDHVHGRIWRVTAKGRDLVKRPGIKKASEAKLLHLLGSSEEWLRLHAKLELKSRNRDVVLKAVREWLEQLDRDSKRYWHDRLEILWVFQNLNTIDTKYLAELCEAPDHRVRAAAMRVVSQWIDDLNLGTSHVTAGSNASQLRGLLEAGVSDEHPRVRLEAVRGWKGIAEAESAQQALKALDQPMDRFLDFALWQTLRDLRESWLPGVVAGKIPIEDEVAHWVFALRAVESPEAIPVLLKAIRNQPLEREQMEAALGAIASLGGPAEIGELLQLATNPKTDLTADRRVEILGSLLNTSRQRKIRPAGDLNVVKRLVESKDAALRAVGLEACGLWRLPEHFSLVKQTTTDPSQEQTVRVAAMDALAAYGSEPALIRLAALAAKGRPAVERVAAVNALSSVAPERGAKLAVELIRESPEGLVVADLVSEFNARKDGGEMLARALVGVKIDADAAKLLVRAVRASGRPSPTLIASIRAAGSLAAGGWKLDANLMKTLITSVQNEGQAALGEAIYRRKDLQCTKCHAIGGAGGKVGPDLISVGGSAPVDYLIESMLAPNKKIKENFHSLQILCDDGRVVTGIPLRKTKTEIVLRNAEDATVTIPVDIIEESKQGRSMMPDGTVDSLTRAELVHLVRFLSELGKVGTFSVGKEEVVRRWETLLWTDEANRRLNRTSFDTAAGDDPALRWESRYSRVAGSLPVQPLPRFQPHKEVHPTSFVRAHLIVSTAGTVRIACRQTKGLSLWVDGRPTEVLAEIELALNRGQHTLTVGIDRQVRVTPLRLELLPGPADSARAKWRSGK